MQMSTIWIDDIFGEARLEGGSTGICGEAADGVENGTGLESVSTGICGVATDGSEDTGGERDSKAAQLVFVAWPLMAVMIPEANGSGWRIGVE